MTTRRDDGGFSRLSGVGGVGVGLQIFKNKNYKKDLHVTVNHDTIETNKEPHGAVRKDGRRMLKERIEKIFNLKRIQNFVEANIDQMEWVEVMPGEKRRILVIETLVDGGFGAYIPGMILELFGRANGYDLEDPYSEKNETIYDTLECLENEINRYLEELLPAKGIYYIGYHEADGSYCLFYEEEK